MANFKDIAGKKFNMLTAIRYVGDSKWLFRCDCGEEHVFRAWQVIGGRTKSCGCHRSKPRKDITGERFGKVVAIKYMTNGEWLFKCDCGKEFVSRATPFRRKIYKSCGCYRYDIPHPSIIHNHSHTDTYSVWLGMKRRCNNPHFRGYKNYGGRGIKVCDRWLHSFDKFLADMGERPGKEYSLDRIDVNGDYSPENCRWATRKEQANNTTKTIHFTHNGVTHSIAEWSEIYGIPQRTAHGRYKRGFSFEKIFSKTHALRILTDDEVKSVRADNLTTTTFFERFGKKVSNSTLRNIKDYKDYTDVV